MINYLTLSRIAHQYGTPCYVYDQRCIEANIKAYQSAFANSPHHICYAVKANDNLAILQLMHQHGLGFDVVSGGELRKVMAVMQAHNAKPHKVIYSGVGKTVAEIEYALAVGIDAFDIESLPELTRIAEMARKQGKVAPISIRYNPNVDAKTHPYISTGLHENKFGLENEQALRALAQIREDNHLQLVGINMHIGSQILDLTAFESALRAQSDFVRHCQRLGHAFSHVNCGGGLGLSVDSATDHVNSRKLVAAIRAVYPEQHIILEPGRSIIGRAGYLLMQVQYVKVQAGQTFVIVDAGMNDYLRVALYGAEHDVFNVSNPDVAATQSVQVVGPVCESGDFFHKSATLHAKAGDVLAFGDAGAYGAVMSSTYNSRGRAAEILVDGEHMQLIRPRENIENIIAAELAFLQP